MTNEMLDLVTPVILHSGKTAWAIVGKVFIGGRDAKYMFKASLSSLPVTMFSGNPVDFYVFKPREDFKVEEAPISTVTNDYDCYLDKVPF